MAHMSEGARKADWQFLQVDKQVLGPDVVLLLVVGELDMVSAPVLRERVLHELREHRHVVLDFSAVGFLGSAGIQVLVEAHDTAIENGGTLHVAGTGGRVVTRPLQLTGVDKLLNLEEGSAVALGLRLLGVHGGSTAVPPDDRFF
jgi:anti-sigma B factor antagonist